MNNTLIMQKLHALLDAYIPAIVVDLLVVIALLTICVVVIRYNVTILRMCAIGINKLQEIVIRLTSKTATDLNRRMHRLSTIHSEKRSSVFLTKLDTLIVDMDLYRDGVTAFGLLLFLCLIALVLTLVLSIVFNLGAWSVVAYIAVMYVVYTVFNVIAMTKVEKREAMIMDVEDLLVSDIEMGVYNCIVRYKDNIHPDIATYFQQFVDNVSHNGWSFAQAMAQLNKELGSTFTDFATKAVMYEQTADKDSLEIFSAVIDLNAHKRRLREQNNIIFAQVRTAFIACLAITVVTAVVMCIYDQPVRAVFAESNLGRFMIIADVFIVAWSLAKLSALKNQRM